MILAMSVGLVYIVSLWKMWDIEELDILFYNLLTLFHMVKRGIGLFISKKKAI